MSLKRWTAAVALNRFWTIVLRASIFASEIVADILALVLAVRGNLLGAAAAVLLAVGCHAAGRVSSRTFPIPMPYFLRWVLHVPRGQHAPKAFLEILQPRSGERILEIGPGIGIHALPVASCLKPDGIVDVLDVQQEMLVDLMRRAEGGGFTNIVPRKGDAQDLPYLDRTFDAAYLIGVLGEIPDPLRALRELRRVLKAGGRLVIAEVFIDPDFISRQALREMARESGFVWEHTVGGPFVYSAVLRPTAAASITYDQPPAFG